jgi:anti-sigma factor RsiW
MARQLNPEELEGLLGAFALGAVDDDERAQLEAYVADHPGAAEELEQLQDAAVWLAVSGAPASRDLWDKISAATKPEPAPLRLPDRRHDSGAKSWFTPRRVLALAAAFVLVIAVAVGVVVSRDDSGSQSDLASAIANAQFSRDARRIHLESSTGDARAEAVMLPNGTGYLVSSDLPKLSTNRTYQLWAIDGSNIVSLGVLGPDLGPSAFKFVGTPKTLAITDEVAGGVPQPTSNPLVSGRVPA